MSLKGEALDQKICLHISAHLEQIGAELSQGTSKRENWQNGYSNDHHEKPSINAPESVVDPHRQFLMILSNIGYCKDELASELYNKYKYTWLQSRRNYEDISALQDLIMSFSGLGEKWGAAPPVKGIRDDAVELLHTLVAVHAEVFPGAKPLLEKILSTLVEGLIDTFLSLLEENRYDDLSLIYANGFCQLMLDLKSLQGAVLEKAIESISETAEKNPGGHHRKPTRGSEDAISDDKQSSASPDDLLALAQQCTSEMLQLELEKTRLNSACFVETLPLDSVHPVVRSSYSSSRASMDSPSRNYRESQSVGSPVGARPRRR